MQFIQSLLLTPYGALTALLAVLVLGELVAKLTQGAVPMALTVTLLLLALFWTKVFPAEIVAASGITALLFSLTAALLVTNMGTLISRREMIAQWQTVVICLMGVAAIIAICLTVGAGLFGMSNAAAAAPPLTGAAIATAMVRERAAEVGNNQAALVAMVCMSLQGIVGYPLTALCLRKEVQRLKGDYASGLLRAPAAEGAAEGGKVKTESTNMILMKLSLLALVSYLLQVGTTKLGFSVSMYVWALFLGFIGHETGFLYKANAYGFCIAVLMIYLFGGLASSDLQSILAALKVSGTLVLLAAAAMAAIAVVAGKLFKKSFWISYATVLNAFLGFPVNVMLANEALDLNISDPQEKAAISGEIMPVMLVGSVTCVTIVAVSVAGVLLKFIV